MVWVTIPVTGMTCASCVRRVERTLEKVPGVLKTSVNLANEKATVGYLTGEVELRDLEKAVEGAGYGVVRGEESIGVDSHEREYKELKADFILANPPFNMSDWGQERLKDDVRWKYGLPPKATPTSPRIDSISLKDSIPNMRRDK